MSYQRHMQITEDSLPLQAPRLHHWQQILHELPQADLQVQQIGAQLRRLEIGATASLTGNRFHEEILQVRQGYNYAPKSAERLQKLTWFNCGLHHSV
jgi:hypothetical protein